MSMPALTVRILLMKPFLGKNNRQAKAVSPPTHRPFVQTDSGHHLGWVSELFWPVFTPPPTFLCLEPMFAPRTPNRPWYKLCKRVDRLSSLFFPRLIVALDRGCPFKLSERPFQPRKACSTWFPFDALSVWMMCQPYACTSRQFNYLLERKFCLKRVSQSLKSVILSGSHLRQQPFKFSKGGKVCFTNPQAWIHLITLTKFTGWAQSKVFLNSLGMNKT